MPKLLQINVCSNILSIGKISEDIAKVAKRYGWECYISYARMHRDSISEEYKIGTLFDVYEHYFEHCFFDREGLASKLSTKKLVSYIKKVNPDVIQLHDIHDHYLNYPILFEFLASTDKPVVWVQHDCWAFTGGCMYYDMLNCYQWKTGCHSCPQKRALFRNIADKQYLLKKYYFSKIKHLYLVSVSHWMSNMLSQSFLGSRRIETIHNGIDLNIFKPYEESKKKDNIIKLLGVAAVWDARKGLNDFIELRHRLPENYQIKLVGLSNNQIKNLPDGILGISRTTNMEELAQIYSESTVLVNPTYSDNFPTTNIEALACGTPIVTYNTGGSPEAIDDKTGIVVEQGDVSSLIKAIMDISKNPPLQYDCRTRAKNLFDKDQQFKKYINLYNEVLKQV